MADGETPGGSAGDTANTQQRPGGEPIVTPQAHAGAYPPYPPYSYAPYPPYSYAPYPPYPIAPTSTPPGTAGAPGAQQPGTPLGQPSPTSPYGYPQYPYPPGYAPAQYPYPYPYPSPYSVPQPARESNRALWITLSVVGATLLVVCVSCSVLFAVSIGRAANGFSQVLGPTLAADTFCVDMQDQRYSAAYDQLSRNLQSQMTRDQFESAAGARDQTSGPVTDCTPDTNSQPTNTSGPPTLVHVTVTRGSGSAGDFTYRGDLTLVQEDGVWKVDAIDSSLGLI